jgi:hypothetical protein
MFKYTEFIKINEDDQNISNNKYLYFTKDKSEIITEPKDTECIVRGKNDHKAYISNDVNPETDESGNTIYKCYDENSILNIYYNIYKDSKYYINNKEIDIDDYCQILVNKKIRAFITYKYAKDVYTPKNNNIESNKDNVDTNKDDSTDIKKQVLNLIKKLED